MAEQTHCPNGKNVVTKSLTPELIRRIQADAIRWCTDKEVLHMRLKAEELDPKGQP
jgi:hypothetical protein